MAFEIFILYLKVVKAGDSGKIFPEIRSVKIG